ncbi:MAG: IS30 family transposase [Candidatus Rickettsiella isopodorum]
MGYKQLDFRKRCQIYGLWKSGHNQTEIAKEIGVHKSTISREFKRNTCLRRRVQWGSWEYKTHYAQTYAEERHKNKPKRIKLTKVVEKFIEEKVQFEWSPEQISGYAKRHNLFAISHECIYQYILKDKQKGGNLYKHLRHQNKRYRKRYGSPKRLGSIKNRRFIDLRPAIVDEKRRLGDWEIDTIIGKNHKQAIVTLVERVSKKTILSKVNAKKADLVSSSIISSLKPLVNQVFTITSDNGSEFAYHEKISRELETEFYFAHPYSSWERGLNENTNGLIRQYLKKGCDFSPVTDNELEFIMDRLNNRPRKALGFSTPHELFYASEYL